MESELIIENIGFLAELRHISKNRALVESGAGKDFIANMRKGQVPSGEKLQRISNYFNVPIDELINKHSIDTIRVVMEQGERKQFVEQLGQRNITTPITNVLNHGHINMPDTVINVYNPNVANAYNSLTEKQKLEVQMFILDKAQSTE